MLSAKSLLIAVIAVIAMAVAAPVASATTTVVESGEDYTLTQDVNNLANVTIAGDVSQCKYLKGIITRKNFTGTNVLYRIWAEWKFCYNGSKITKLWDYNKGRTDLDSTWEWIGWEGTNRGGGVGTGGASIRSFAHLKQCINVPFWSCSNAYPDIYLGVDNSGAVTVQGRKK